MLVVCCSDLVSKSRGACSTAPYIHHLVECFTSTLLRLQPKSSRIELFPASRLPFFAFSFFVSMGSALISMCRQRSPPRGGIMHSGDAAVSQAGSAMVAIAIGDRLCWEQGVDSVEKAATMLLMSHVMPDVTKPTLARAEPSPTLRSPSANWGLSAVRILCSSAIAKQLPKCCPSADGIFPFFPPRLCIHYIYPQLSVL
jgi:hypothetical protein